jgi:hypothetical protein
VAGGLLVAGLARPGIATAAGASYGSLLTDAEVNYSEGNFGGPDTSRTLRTLASIRYTYRAVEAEVTFSYLRDSNVGITVHTLAGPAPVADTVFRDRILRQAGVERPRSPGGRILPRDPRNAGRTGKAQEELPPFVFEEARITTDGFGDVELRLGYEAVEEGKALPFLAPFAKVKIPTADDEAGLGTGKPDAALGVYLFKGFGDIYGSLEISGTYIGRLPDVPFRNTLGATGAVGYRLADRLTAYAFSTLRSSATRGRPASAEVGLGGLYRILPGLRLKLSGTAGLSDSTPDYGLTLSLAYAFF